MRNRSQDRGQPRLVMQINRNEQVPKLVTMPEASRSKDARNKLLMQARTTIAPRRHQSRFEMTALNDSLNEERKEKEELRHSVRQLTHQLQKLREVNQGLIARVREVESSYRTLQNEFDGHVLDERRKIKHTIYADIEQYVKTMVERLTLNLRQERMTPSVENKLQKFMAELMEINSISVEQQARRSRTESMAIKPDPIINLYPPGVESQISSVGRYLSDYKTKESHENEIPLPSREQYASIMQRLTGEPLRNTNMSKSFITANNVYHSNSKDHGKLSSILQYDPIEKKEDF